MLVPRRIIHSGMTCTSVKKIVTMINIFFKNKIEMIRTKCTDTVLTLYGSSQTESQDQKVDSLIKSRL